MVPASKQIPVRARDTPRKSDTKSYQRAPGSNRYVLPTSDSESELTGPPSPTPIRKPAPKTNLTTGSSTLLPNMSTSNSKGPAIAVPTPFDGTREKTKRFMHECELYIRGCPEYFTKQDANKQPVVDEEKKIMFVLSYMKSGTAASWAEQYSSRPKAGNAAKGEKEQHDKYDSFKSEFLKAFEETHRGEKARYQLSKLVQGKYSVDAYNTAFNDLIQYAGLNEVAMIHQYMQGLNDNIRDKLLLMENLPDTLQATQDKASTFGLRETTRNNYARGGRIDAKDVMNRLQAGGTPSNPITLEQRYTQLSDEERKKLMSENRCFHCREQGHRAFKCPKKKQQNNNRGFNNRGFNNRKFGNQSNSNNWRSNNSNPMSVRTATVAEQLTELIGQANEEELNEMHLQIIDASANKEEDFQSDD